MPEVVPTIHITVVGADGTSVSTTSAPIKKVKADADLKLSQDQIEALIKSKQLGRR